jgi:shikimate dehydrogenase
MSDAIYRLGLVGFPLEHSLSPVMHLAALRALSLEGDYRIYPIPPGSDDKSKLAGLMQALRAGQVTGLNVTIPYKRTVLPMLDDLTPGAAAIGAVNTIFRQGRRLVGDNTDAPGFLEDLDDFLGANGGRASLGQPGCQSALILGAGGAARAVANALRERGWPVLIAARRLGQAEALIQRLSSAGVDSNLQAMPLEAAALEGRRDEISLIVNATPLGAPPQVESSPWPDEVPLPHGARIYDLVYNPPETPLMRRARRAGLPARSGLGMLAAQAALSFQRWTGQAAPRRVMQAAALDRLGQLQTTYRDG